MDCYEFIAYIEAIILSTGGPREIKRQRIDDLCYQKRHLLIMTRDVLTVEIKKMEYKREHLKDSNSVSDMLYLLKMNYKMPLWKAIRTIVSDEIQMYRELGREQRLQRQTLQDTQYSAHRGAELGRYTPLQTT